MGERVLKEFTSKWKKANDNLRELRKAKKTHYSLQEIDIISIDSLD